MDKFDNEYWQKLLNIALENEEINDPLFHKFMRGKIKRLPLQINDFGWGVFPRLNTDNILQDIRMVVPVVRDIETLCVNIHEYVHAYEMYTCLGEVYEWHIEESEEKAKAAEKRFLLHYKSDNGDIE